jgi:acetoin utilization protein AcuB
MRSANPEEGQMVVRDVMTEDPFTIEPDASLDRASDLMCAKDLRHLPVVDPAGRLIGIIAERDLRRAALAPAVDEDISTDGQRPLCRPGQAPQDLLVKDVMSCDVLTTHPEAPLAHAARVMFERRVGSLPVILDGRLVGMLTERDVTRALANGRIGGEFDREGLLW